MVIPVPPEGRKRQRVILDYELDLGQTLLVRNDLIINPADNTYVSPVTSKYFEKEVASIGTGVAVTRKELEPRKFETCNDNNGSERLLTVICPFRSFTDANIQSQEIQNDYTFLRLRMLPESIGEILERNLI